jgi:phytol kinase
MLALAAAIVGVFILVVIGEYLQRVKRYHPEVTRKFIHISVATFAATWPFFMSWRNITLMSLLMFIGIVVSRHLTYFKAIHTVKRHTWGELFYAMAIGLAAVLSQEPWVFAAAMLHLGLADGLAALVGTLFGRLHRYKVFGHWKSRAGTLTFYVVSVLITLFCVVLADPNDGWLALLWLPPLVTLAENVGVAGIDNLLVPMMIVMLLN